MFNVRLKTSTQSIISFVISVVITLFGFISTIIFTRVLGADLLGVYYLFLAYFSIFNVFSEFGLGNGLVKKISEGEQELNYFSAYFTLRMIFLVAVTILLLFLIPTSEVFLWVIVALCIFLFLNRYLLDSWNKQIQHL